MKQQMIDPIGVRPASPGGMPSQCPTLRSTPAIIRADRLPVIDCSGKTLCHGTASAAKNLIARGTVTAVGNQSTIRALKLAPGEDRLREFTLSAYAGQKYSHKRETDDNPAGVWTLKRLPKAERPAFQRVVLDCIRRAA